MLQEHMNVYERVRCRKDMVPETILLGRGINNDTTVIAGWSAI